MNHQTVGYAIIVLVSLALLALSVYVFALRKH
jgi:hypothetical protein